MSDKGEPSPAWKMYVDISRTMREENGLSQEELGRQISYTGAAISAFETFKVFPSQQLMAGLEATLGANTKLLHKAGRHLLYERYPPHFKDYAKLEATALSISSYETLVIDGLFQTEAYARAVLHCGFPSPNDEEVERLTEARMARKALFDRHPSPLFFLVQEESTLRRQIGSREVMRGQLEYLSDLAQLRNVTVQVLSLNRGSREENAGLNGPMKLIETPEHQPLVYLESQDHSWLISAPDKVSPMVHRYAMIRSQALGTDESLALIQKLAGEL